MCQVKKLLPSYLFHFLSEKKYTNNSTFIFLRGEITVPCEDAWKNRAIAIKYWKARSRSKSKSRSKKSEFHFYVSFSRLSTDKLVFRATVTQRITSNGPLLLLNRYIRSPPMCNPWGPVKLLLPHGQPSVSLPENFQISNHQLRLACFCRENTGTDVIPHMTKLL